MAADTMMSAMNVVGATLRSEKYDGTTTAFLTQKCMSNGRNHSSASSPGTPTANKRQVARSNLALVVFIYVKMKESFLGHKIVLKSN